jgi:hypothetical protein
VSDARPRMSCRKPSQKLYLTQAASDGRNSHTAANSVPSLTAYDGSWLPLTEQNVNQLTANVKTRFNPLLQKQRGRHHHVNEPRRLLLTSDTAGARGHCGVIIAAAEASEGFEFALEMFDMRP